ncbi:alcohol dehydrogenase [Colletotrichum truncatum]|uniref:Alcohol dehydrogenase n=1 Tax=Colletotrichum truncatum TaxID=5467 RepID=A0ACC3YRK4_COLTU|nr:alcohol dehydrogenase [Colletotrichum truncatum]KAF6784240.1 alcohol dehydrogenase [Colletotrichum truncatum]
MHTDAMSSTAPALFVDEDCVFKVIQSVPIPEPEESELVIKVCFSGVNPGDVMHAPRMGVRSVVIGYDFSGHVVQANPNSGFKVGDAVAGHTPTGMGKPLKYGAHQEYLACPEELVFRVPDNLPLEHAACLATVVTTAADGLYNIFGYPLPGEEVIEEFKPGPLLIWGASTSVGFCMVQLARASGAFPIFVTASPKRHELLQKMGATRCFDYASPNIVSQVQAAVAETKAEQIAYAADCAGTRGEASSAGQMFKCVGEDTELLSVIGGPDERWKMPLAVANASVKFAFMGGPPVEFPARREDFGRMWKALTWAVENYRVDFSLPVVDVFSGEAEKALEEVKKVGELGKFGKLVLKQPLSWK